MLTICPMPNKSAIAKQVLNIKTPGRPILFKHGDPIKRRVKIVEFAIKREPTALKVCLTGVITIQNHPFTVTSSVVLWESGEKSLREFQLPKEWYF